MSDIKAVEIDISTIANGVIGKVIVRHGHYQASVTPARYFKTLDEALDTLRVFAGDPENVIAAHPAEESDIPY